MRIDFVEIKNFRKLRSTRVGFSKTKTVFVGANNSGKTSAMVALRYFLIERSNFALTDFTISNWPVINAMGHLWEAAKSANQPVPAPDWERVLPFLDLWLHVEENEVHYVQGILPTLDWEGGRLGVRLRFEPKDTHKDTEELQAEYLAARSDVSAIIEGAKEITQNGTSKEVAEGTISVPLWPQNLTEFLKRRLGTLFGVSVYVLNPAECHPPEHGIAKPQTLPEGSVPLNQDPLKLLIRIDQISAQRGFGQSEHVPWPTDHENTIGRVGSGSRRLSEQLRRYYRHHLDPYKNPNSQDLQALCAIEDAQRNFDVRLKSGFESALNELLALGYPGVTDPALNISTRLRPVDGLDHDAAVQYVIKMVDGDSAVDLNLPEDSNGLGYQNLISMVFNLMSYRDAWMRVGKANATPAESGDTFIPPLHLVLIEEPEVHLHTQVQQVFIRKAYDILRSNENLKGHSDFTTQLVVSTHSSHLAHECEFSSLRYFRRRPANVGDIPTACVVDLTDVFGNDEDTKRFVTRYLKVTHCDLLFADAVVLIEGTAERILAPHFVRHHDDLNGLLECYVTWLEISGSHAHRFRGLIESLGLTTLIITDLDAVDQDGKSTTPKRASSQRSGNPTLKSWWPAKEDLDTLLDMPESGKTQVYEDQHFAIRVAYQCPITITFKSVTGEALPNTLEDAIVLQNLSLFAALPGKGFIAKCRKSIEESSTLSEFCGNLLAAIANCTKAQFALDILEIADPQAIQPPAYIHEGLLWLARQVREHQNKLGLPFPKAIEPELTETH